MADEYAYASPANENDTTGPSSDIYHYVSPPPYWPRWPCRWIRNDYPRNICIEDYDSRNELLRHVMSDHVARRLFPDIRECRWLEHGATRRCFLQIVGYSSDKPRGLEHLRDHIRNHLRGVDVFGEPY